MKQTKSLKDRNWYALLFSDSILPKYIPFYYRLYLITWPRLCETIKRRLKPARVREGVSYEQFEDSVRILKLGNTKSPLINKTCSSIDDDLRRDDVQSSIREISKLGKILNDKGLRYTNFAGNFKAKYYIPEKEQYKLWENTWMLANSKVRAQDKVLDIGGASSIFSFYLAYMGADVHVLDNDSGNHGIIYNARFIGKKMDWKLKVYKRDISEKLPFRNDYFDKVFCICVMEHLPSAVRQKAMYEINRVLKPGGVVGLTFDYDSVRNDVGLDKGLRYALKTRLIDDIIKPSGLEILGNNELVDDCPKDFFLGTLFLTKPRG